LICEGERETSARFVDESSRRRSSSLNLNRGKTKEEIEGYPIIVDELFFLEDTMAGTKTLVETRDWGSCTPLPRGETNLTTSSDCGRCCLFYEKRKSLPIWRLMFQPRL
jgi:hypothetical protein